MLKINPYQSYNNNSAKYHNKKINNTNNISFGGNPLAEKLAKDYVYLKDYETRLINVIYNRFGYQDYDILNEAIRLIKKFRSDAAAKDNQLAEFPKVKEKLNTAIKNEINKQNELEEKISAVDKLTAVEKLKLSKIIASEKRKNTICEMLQEKYVGLHKLKEKTYPNALMIMGLQDESEQQFVLQFLQNTGNKIFKIDFENIPKKSLLAELGLMFKRIKAEGEHALLYIKNFRKYTVPTEENFNFIQPLKGTLTKTGRELNTTVLVFENHPETLDAAIQGQHRFKRLDVSDIKSEITGCFIPKYDGYTYVYDVNKEDFVDLYLGNFGYSRNILWVDSNNNKKIRTIIDRIDEIKKHDKFGHIKYIHFPAPDSLQGIRNYQQISELTKDFQNIYRVNI